MDEQATEPPSPKRGQNVLSGTKRKETDPRQQGLRFSFSSLASFLLLGLSFLVLVGEAGSGQASDEASPQGDSAAEECLWQNDVDFFSTLSETGKAVLPSVTECPVPVKPGEVPAEPAAPSALEAAIEPMVSGFPIEVMVPAIAKYDSSIAGLIVGIAKKESNWGKRVPKLSGEECFNYWGYRGPGSRGLTEDGYGCFATPEEAVQMIGDRLVTLAEKRLGSDPKKMIVWKCGSTCAGHSEYSVSKWISDVELYYRQIVGKGD